ncbi:MAG: FAD binding domain-containing protein [Planctomycetota bacterium]|jgi:carbon-monoxide dehydrogenase medium subunit
MDRYTYLKPKTLDEALALRAATPAAMFVAGGTDLMVQMKKRTRKPPPALISLRSVAELGTIETDDAGRIRIGAGVPLTDIARHPQISARYQALVDSIDVLGSHQIRNVATLGGNLCNASPAADTAPPLLVHDARVEVRSAITTRELALEGFFVGPGATTLAADEILTAVVLDPPPPGARAVFLRKSRIKMDIATVCLAVLVEISGNTLEWVRIAAGAVAPVPLRLTAAEAILQGSRLDGDAVDSDTLARACEAVMAQVAPISDLRSTEEYRRHLVGVFLKRAMQQAVAGAMAGSGR